ncbi:MAG: hypothetical protein WA087_01745, partial [Candidatus Saccharimonadales bacterium]
MKNNNIGKILVPSVLFLSIFFATNAHAIYDVDYGKGYFYGHKMCTTSSEDGDKDGDGTQDCMEGDMDDSDFYVLPSGSLSGIDKADELYNKLVSYNDSDNDRKKAGSGLIVNTMMGRDSDGEGKDISDGTWRDLKARLRSMDAKGKIKWTGNYTYCNISSFYTKYYYKSSGEEKNNKDIAFYELEDCETDPAIRFYDDDDNLVYVLSRQCGNPVGSLSELPEANDWKVSVKSEIKNRSSLPLTVGSTITWKHTIKNDGPDETDIDVYYKYKDGGVLGGGSGPDHEFSEGADSGHDESFESTSRAITQDDVGGQMCRLTSAEPKSWESEESIKSPYDCITIPYNYSLNPSANVPGDFIEADVRFSFTPSVINEVEANKTRSESIEWRVTEVVYNPGVAIPNPNDDNFSDQGPCPDGLYFNPNNSCRNVTPVADGTGNTVFNEDGSYRSGDNLLTTVTVGGYDVGTNVCYSLSIKPNRNTIASGKDDRWRHSSLGCMVIAKKPKVQIWGGDVMSGGIIQTSTSSKNISGTTRMFGSWDEYAALAVGSISGMGSGAAFADPGMANSTICNYSTLSFTNAGNNASC